MRVRREYLEDSRRLRKSVLGAIPSQGIAHRFRRRRRLLQSPSNPNRSDRIAPRFNGVAVHHGRRDKSFNSTSSSPRPCQEEKCSTPAKSLKVRGFGHDVLVSMPRAAWRNYRRNSMGIVPMRECRDGLPAGEQALCEVCSFVIIISPYFHHKCA